MGKPSQSTESGLNQAFNPLPPSGIFWKWLSPSSIPPELKSRLETPFSIRQPACRSQTCLECLPSCLCWGWGLTLQPSAPPTCSALPSPCLPPAHPLRLTGQNGYTVYNVSSYLSVSLCINSPLTLSLHPPKRNVFLSL